MSQNEVRDWVKSTPRFRKAYRDLLLRSVSEQFVNLSHESNLAFDLGYLVNCASVLSGSLRGEDQDLAYRIAQYSVTQGELAFKVAGTSIFSALSNQLSIRLAEARNLVPANIEDGSPLMVRMNRARDRVRSLIVTARGESFSGNMFQTHLWEQASVHDAISVSAPTSVGKSYALAQIVVEHLRQPGRPIVLYIVPTRSLMQQVATDLREMVNSSDVRATISSLPVLDPVSHDGPTVFVLTQERATNLLNDRPKDWVPSLLVVDEAQKIGDGDRGIILESILLRVSWHSRKVKSIFASPLVLNPEVLLKEVEPERCTAIVDESVVVNQNLLWVTQDSRDAREWSLELLVSGEPVRLGSIRLAHAATQSTKRMPLIAAELGAGESGNLLYVNGAADAEKTALILSDALPTYTLSAEQRDSLDSLMALVKSAVHPKYSLVTVLNKGVGFHYGNMPLVVRTAIEKLFDNGSIRYLVCTSTLIEGVNLSCRNVFVRGPQKGRNTPMAADDFWNLAGRAGRWGKEFQGNVVCIDAKRADVWKVAPPTHRLRHTIRRQTQAWASDEATVLSSLERRQPSSYDGLISFLFCTMASGRSLSGLASLEGISSDTLASAGRFISEILTESSWMVEVVQRNPSVGVFGLLQLYDDFLVRGTDAPSSARLLPPDPASDRAVKDFADIFALFGKFFRPKHIVRGREWPLAILVVNWMNGYGLPRIIDKRVAFRNRSSEVVDVGRVIRETLSDIEQVARFEAPKMFSAYCDVLRAFYDAAGHTALALRIPDLSLRMELGVSDLTQQSLIGIGLSRTSAILLSEFIYSADFSTSECIQWMRDCDLDSFPLPIAVREEIRNLLRNLRSA